MIFFDRREGKASQSLRPAVSVLIFAALVAWTKDLLGDLFKHLRAFLRASRASQRRREGRIFEIRAFGGEPCYVRVHWGGWGRLGVFFLCQSSELGGYIFLEGGIAG